MDKLTVDTLDANTICDFAEDVRALIVRALGEEEADLGPTHPLTKRAKRELCAAINAIRAERIGSIR